MYTEGAQCTANFVSTDAADNVYVGYAAHCAGLGEATETNGCLAETLSLGTKVTLNTGGSLIGSGRQVGTGTLEYSSWVAMHRNGETAGSLGTVNPTVPYFGGPNALAPAAHPSASRSTPTATPRCEPVCRCCHPRSDLGRELDYARTHSGITGLTLVPGTRPFSSSL
jgi:hypothetical protein